MDPKFAMPERFKDYPVIAGIYVPGTGKYPPSVWVVVAEDFAGSEYHVGFILPEGNSMQSWHFIPSRIEALDTMREQSEFWRNLIK